MARADEIRLMTKVAHMYYDQGIRQQEITERLNVHQSTISRLLKRARDLNIVRISVAVPPGIFSELEESLERRFGLKEAVVIDTPADGDRLIRDLGAAAAFFVENTVKPGTVIGISSWSGTLIAMVDALHQSNDGRGGKVIQILGGIGAAGPQHQATHLAQELARRLSATPILLHAPGVVGSEEASRLLLQDPSVLEVSELFGSIDLALVGVGWMEPSTLLASSGNVFPPAELEELSRMGAVGDICLRFFDRQGCITPSALMNRVIGIELPVLKRAKRVVGVAGGDLKVQALLGAVRGGWINVLITDRRTAEQMLAMDKA